jgi:hypothetical protein
MVPGKTVVKETSFFLKIVRSVRELNRVNTVFYWEKD